MTSSFSARLIVLAILAGLSVNTVHAGSLAPETRVISERGRDFLERSGAQTLEELLDTGIVRYFFTGGQPLAVLVNGRPYATTASDLDTLPLSAIERLELVTGDTLGTLGGWGARGAINVVLRKDLDGVETRALTRMPTRDGGDGLQGSAFWGGPVGKGHMTFGVDVLQRQEIPSSEREYSRSTWQPGGTFGQAKNVSIGGNTVWVIQREDDGEVTDVRSVSLGDCDPGKNYTGPLLNPPGITVPGDKGCGFAYGGIAWNTTSYDQKTAVVNLDHPVDDVHNVHIDAIINQVELADRFAPSVGTFYIEPNSALIAKINADGGSFTADRNDWYAVGHRFVGHGNRDWLWESDEYDVSMSVDGPLADDLGYDVRISGYYLDGSLTGDTFVHEGVIQQEIKDGYYDLANPFSRDPEHLEAISKSSLREDLDVGAEVLETRMALEGSGFGLGGRPAAWTAGVELARLKQHSILRFVDREGDAHDVTEVLGSSGTSYEGERDTVSAFADLFLPLTGNVDLRIAGRGDELDDVGGMSSFSLAGEYRPFDSVALRSSWTTGQRPPGFWHLHSTASQDHPYIGCDPGSPPQPCTQSNPRQVTRETTGNTDLDPSDVQRFAVGAEYGEGPFALNVEWYRLSRSDLVGQNSADWAMQNLANCEDDAESNCIRRRGGAITIFDSYANVIDTEISGITARFGASHETDWATVRLSGAWRHVNSAELTIAGTKERYALSRDMARVRLAAERDGLSAIWTVNYRSGFTNQSGSGSFDSWTGHDLVLDWNEPLGLEGLRLAAGVFNLTDAGLTIDTANPGSVDGPSVAGWGRTFFFTLNKRF